MAPERDLLLPRYIPPLVDLKDVILCDDEDEGCCLSASAEEEKVERSDSAAFFILSDERVRRRRDGGELAPSLGGDICDCVSHEQQKA